MGPFNLEHVNVILDHSVQFAQNWADSKMTRRARWMKSWASGVYMGRTCYFEGLFGVIWRTAQNWKPFSVEQKRWTSRVHVEYIWIFLFQTF